MKIIKMRVLIVLIVSLLSVLGYIKYFAKRADSNSQISVAVNLDMVSLPIDPLHNPTLSNAFYTNNLYLNLIDVDDDGVYRPALASAFSWVDNTLIFEFSDIETIGASDAEFNLRRAILSEVNDHADLWFVICGDIKIETECFERIYAKDKKLFLHIKDESKKTLIVPLLAAINYKIVPLAGFDVLDYRKAKIVDYSKTSGYYRVEHNDFNKLVSNSKTREKFKSAPEIANLVNANPGNLLVKMKENSVDVVSSTVPITNETFEEIKKLNWNIFQTFPISIGMAVYSDAAIKKTTVSERFYVGNLIKNELEKNRLSSSKDTIEFLQYFGEGYLTPEQKEKVEILRQAKGRLNTKLLFGVRTPDKWKSIVDKEKNLNLLKITKSVNTLSIADQPDVYVLSNDVSFDIGFSLFSFAVKNGFLSFENLSKEELILKYVEQKTAADRVKFINSAHFDSLTKGRIYPFWSSPYTTLARSNIDIKLSKYNSRTLLWKLSVN